MHQTNNDDFDNGSTTRALADLTYRIHTLLESIQYVRCVLIDFSKAFDTVDHVILARKLFCLETPVFIIQWIMSFLTDRNQATKLGFHLSSALPIYIYIYVYVRLFATHGRKTDRGT